MPQPQTFLRFTTRELLLVMLGLSVAFGILFSLLPALLPIDRDTVAVALGLYLLGFAPFALGSAFTYSWIQKRAGTCLLVYPSSITATWIPVGSLMLAASGLLFWFGCKELSERGDLGQLLVGLLWSLLAGIAAAGGCKFLLRGRSLSTLEFCENGVLAGNEGLIPWFSVRVGRYEPSGSSQYSRKMWLRSKKYRLELTESDREAVEAILIKYKPGYAELANV